ncbi:MAG: phage holin family protein [Oscillospiraceae bacterium]|jgi:hypothetical protein|nr:phage holin family protein [Oscillospiraceae bacterium]
MHSSDIWAMLFNGVLALMGGAVREIDKIGVKGFALAEFIGGVLVSMFSGMVVFFLCMHFQWDLWLTSALTSIAGYSGPKALDFVVELLKKKVDAG